MTPKERRAYALGYRLALRKARRELDAMDAKLRVAHQQTVRRIDDEIAELADEMLSMGNEFRRWQAIEKAIAVQRGPDELLN